MEFKVIPAKLLKALHKLTDEEAEANLRLSLEEVLKSPDVKIEDLPSEIQESAKEAMEEATFFL